MIRDASETDWLDIWPFYAEIVRDGETVAFPEPSTPDADRSVWMQAPPGRTVAALVDGVVVGFAKMGPNRPARGSHIATSFMVSPAHRNVGIGRALGQHVLDWAVANSFQGIQFNAVVETNTGAVHLWESLGFEIVGTVPESFNHKRQGLVGLHVMYQKLARDA